MGVSDNKVFNTLLFTVGSVLAAIVMTGSVFLIYNSFNISLNEHVHQFGILMSVGATGRQLQESVLFEGICIGIAGIPFDAVDTVDGRVFMGALLWSSTPEQTLSAVQAVLTDEGVTKDYMLINLSQAFELFRNLTFVIDVFTYIFVFMISLIAVANVFNTISTNIRLRRRELAMLRSVGMSDRSFNSMMRFECAFYGIRTLLYGIPAATLLSWMIHKALTSLEEMDDIAFAFPWAAMGISVLGVFCIVFITMMYAVSKIKKENIIDALRDDNA